MATVRGVPGKGFGSKYVDALIWGGKAWDLASGPVTYFFGEPVDFALASSIKSQDAFTIESTTLSTWNNKEFATFQRALTLYSEVTRLTFAPANSVDTANLVWWKSDLGDGALGVHDVPSNAPMWGGFNPDVSSWHYLDRGGDGLNTIVHELGHAMGLAHPHDGGGEANATRFPGVSAYAWYDLGLNDMNQGIWSVMSYNTGWEKVGNTLALGAQSGLGAFDIAALQELYGINSTTRIGNDVYALPTGNVKGTGWSAIWDAGGTDTLSAARAHKDVVIDLRPAPLKDGHPHAAGFASSAQEVRGGFTIAHGVKIENALGGFRDDVLIGNSVSNILNGRAGSDKLDGLLGNDVLIGGPGNDSFLFRNKLSPTKNLDRIEDFNPRADHIILENAIFKTLKQIGDLDNDAFYLSNSSRIAHDADDRIIYQSQTGKVFYDRDGFNPATPVAFAILDPRMRMTAEDFIVS